MATGHLAQSLANSIFRGNHQVRCYGDMTRSLAPVPLPRAERTTLGIGHQLHLVGEEQFCVVGG